MDGKSKKISIPIAPQEQTARRETPMATATPMPKNGCSAPARTPPTEQPNASLPRTLPIRRPPADARQA